MQWQTCCCSWSTQQVRVIVLGGGADNRVLGWNMNVLPKFANMHIVVTSLATVFMSCAAPACVSVRVSTDAGVWRSHASSLQVPLLQPVNITATALQLPTRAVAISVTLSLDPGVRTAFVLHQAGLRPQFGLIMGPGFNSSSRVKQQQVHNNNSSSSVGGLLGNDGGCSGSSSSSNVGFSEAVPLVLVPGATAALSFLLLPDPGERHRMCCGVLLLMPSFFVALFT